MRNSYFLRKCQSIKWIVTGLLLMGVGQNFCQAQTCDTPTGLKGESNGYLVALSWDLATRGNTLLETGFEDNVFPPQGWAVNTKNKLDPEFTWFQFPTKNFIDVENYKDFIYEGDKDACVYMAGQTDSSIDPYNGNQDEWLITPEIENAVYLDFYSLIAGDLLDWGTDPEFPDHYYVKVSHDNGATWEVVWDARYDSYGTSDWELISIKIGKKGQKTKVAFQAISSQEDPAESLYCMWNIDNVRISDGSSSQSSPRMEVTKQIRKEKSSLTSKKPIYRPFKSKSGVKATPNSVKAKAEGVNYYNILRNGNIIAEEVRSNWYVDKEEKEPGIYKYEVTAYCVDCEQESAPATTSVEVKKAICNPPKNVRATITPDEEVKGTYLITLHWDTPEGDRQPYAYNCYANGALFAMEVSDEERIGGMGQSQVEEGVYSYSVEALYDYPEGTSKRTAIDVATPKERYPVKSVSVSLCNDKMNSANILWEAPDQTNGFTIKGYNVYCSTKRIAEAQTGTSFIYENIPNGVYTYYVKVLYDDGVESSAKSISVTTGEMPVYDITTPPDYKFSEDFSNLIQPDNWQIFNDNEEDEYATVWEIKDITNTSITDNPLIKGGLAIIDSQSGGFSMQSTSLCTPLLSYNSTADVELYLSFDYDYPTAQSSTATLRVSQNGGETWKDIETLEGDPIMRPSDVSTPKHKEYAVRNYFENGKKVMFSWYYEGAFDIYLAIDNVTISTTTSGIQSTNQTDVNLQVNGRILTVNAPDISIKGISILSTDGKVLLMNKGENTLSAETLEKGIYIARIDSEKGVQFSKIILK